MEMQKVHDMVHQDEPSTLLQRELHTTLLMKGGMHSWLKYGSEKIEANKALAIKAGMGMPWTKVRLNVHERTL